MLVSLPFIYWNPPFLFYIVILRNIDHGFPLQSSGIDGCGLSSTSPIAIYKSNTWPSLSSRYWWRPWQCTTNHNKGIIGFNFGYANCDEGCSRYTFRLCNVMSLLEDDLGYWVKAGSTTWFSHFLLDQYGNEKWITMFSMIKTTVFLFGWTFEA